MGMNRLLAGVCGVLLLTGCAMFERPVDNAKVTFGGMTQYEYMIKYYGPTCESIGFKPGSDGYGNCLLKMQQNAIAGSR